VIQQNVKSAIDKEVEKILRESNQWGKFPTDFNAITEAISIEFNETPIESKGFFHSLLSLAKDGAKKILEKMAEKVPLLEDAFKKVRGIYLFHERVILVDHSSHFQRIKWYKWHELGHAAIPWHEPILKQCREEDMNPWAREEIEAEANYCASQFVFQGKNFTNLINDLNVDNGFETIDLLHNQCNISLESTAREFARNRENTNFCFILVRQSAKTGQVFPFDHSLPSGIKFNSDRFHFVKNDVFARAGESDKDRIIFDGYHLIINEIEILITVDILKTTYTNYALFKIPKSLL